ncbi:MAG: hypothetical protein V2I51_19365 [Anderseniella sp.]|jgi:N-carbamoyl-L-amino-acid hydrolase|nr:hypothetical protein [Anderseniella sp.]
MAERLRRAAYEAAAHCGCICTIEDQWHWGGDIFDAELVAAIRAHAERLGVNHRDIKSQAGHDCQSASNRDPLSASNIDPSGAELARRCVVLM